MPHTQTNSHTSRTALITASDTVRDIGIDTLNASLGKLSGEEKSPKHGKFKLRMDAADCGAIIRALLKLADDQHRHNSPHLVTHRTREHEVKYEIETTILTLPLFDGRVIAEAPLKSGETVKIRLRVIHANSRYTDMTVKLTRDRHGHFWVGVLANPTALLSGYNAYAVAFPDTGRHAERRRFQRVPFAVLRRIVRSVVKTFDWHEATKQRIRDLAFRNSPAQLFTYLPTAPRTPADIMSYLRCAYSTPYRSDNGFCLLSDDLGIEVHARKDPSGLQTLLFVFRKDGTVTWSVSFYDKLAKANRYAATINVKVGDADAIRFLRSALRVDITIHEGGQREMFHEATGKDRKDCAVTSAQYCESIKRMDQGLGQSKKKFVRWMLDYIFDDLLKFWSLLHYTPKRLEIARKKLAEYNADAAMGFAEWRDKGFMSATTDKGKRRPLSFVQFMQKGAKAEVTREVARRTRQKLLEMKLDPDLPLRAYNAFFNQTFIWDLTDKERHELAVAFEQRDVETAQALQQRSRSTSLDVAHEVIAAFGIMIESAHVPATTLAAADDHSN